MTAWRHLLVGPTFLAALGLAACGPSGGDGDDDDDDGAIDVDTDGDGLLDSADNCPEVANPEQDDTNDDGIGNVCDPDDRDADGIQDAEDNCPDTVNVNQTDEDADGIGNACELAGCSPPEGEHWPQNDVPEDYEASGTGEGDFAPDFALMDQYGDTVRLHQFYGCKVVLDFSAMWCSPCQEAAESVEEVFQGLRDDFEPFYYITIILDDEQGRQPNQSDLERWAEDYGGGITAPVLGDEDYEVSTEWGIVALPTFYALNTRMRIYDSLEGYSGSTDRWIEDTVHEMN